MKAIIKTILLSLLPIAAVAGVLVWLLPAKVTLFVVIVVQVLILALLGDIVKNRKNIEDHEQE